MRTGASAQKARERQPARERWRMRVSYRTGEAVARACGGRNAGTRQATPHGERRGAERGKKSQSLPNFIGRCGEILFSVVVKQHRW